MAEERSPTFQIPPSGFGDLAALAKHADRLTAVSDLVVEMADEANFDVIARPVADKLGVSVGTAKEILDGLGSLRGLVDRTRLEPHAVLEQLTVSIAAQASERWRSENGTQWKSGQTAIATSISLIPPQSILAIGQKAAELTHAHEHVLSDVSLTTDLRPIYSANGGEIYALVLTHILSIKHRDGNATKRTDFALDADDIEKLTKLVERAKTKIKTARTKLSGAGVRLLVPGDGSLSEERD